MGKGGDTLKGAAAGAATGAALGPYGAAVGGVIGGIAGYLGSSDDGNEANGQPKYNATLANYGRSTAQLGQMAGEAQGRWAPAIQAKNAVQLGSTQLGQAYQLAPGQMNQSRAGMLGTANQLGAIASGQQAGAGELAVNRQVAAASAAQHSAAMMARGSNAALAYRNAARNTMDIGMAGAGQAAGAQMQDQQAANAQLGQLYGSMYGQDANVAGQNAQLGQQRMLQQGSMDQARVFQQGAFDQQRLVTNAQNQLSQNALNDQMQLGARQQMLGWDQAQAQARLGGAQLPTQPSVMGSVLQSAGTAAAMYGAYQGRQPPPAAAAVAPAYDPNGLMKPGA